MQAIEEIAINMTEAMLDGVKGPAADCFFKTRKVTKKLPTTNRRESSVRGDIH